jgi:hypothetical protein
MSRKERGSMVSERPAVSFVDFLKETAIIRGAILLLTGGDK